MRIYAMKDSFISQILVYMPLLNPQLNQLLKSKKILTFAPLIHNSQRLLSSAVEQLIRNEQVAGSNPVGGSKLDSRIVSLQKK